MKKVFTLLSLLFVLSTAVAQDSMVQLGYKYQDTNNNIGPNAQGYNFALGTKLNNNLTVDVASESFFTDNNAGNATRLEVGLTPKLEITPKLAIYSRVAVGQKWVPGDNFYYYSIEPGIKYAVSNSVTAKASFRFRNAFDTVNNDTSRTQTVGLEYALTKSTYVGGFFAHITGDGLQNGNQYMATYGVRF